METELGAAGPSTPTDGAPKVSVERGHRRAEGEGPPTPRSHRPNVPGPLPQCTPTSRGNPSTLMRSTAALHEGRHVGLRMALHGRAGHNLDGLADGVELLGAHLLPALP